MSMKSPLYQNYKLEQWLPTSVKEVEALGWKYLDVIIFTGDAYVDHPSFGAAMIGRMLQKQGYHVAIVPQPNWRDDLRDFKKLGKPNLFFGITSGAMDSMINHYTANKRKRSEDAYTPGGLSGQRPDYAIQVYSSILKDLFPDTPIVAGGVEASLRRFTHYDYWSDTLKPSVLESGKIDYVAYGMAEHSILELAAFFKNKKNRSELGNIHQISYLAEIHETFTNPHQWIKKQLQSFKDCVKSKKSFADSFVIIEEESNKILSAQLIEPCEKGFIITNPSKPESSVDENDEPYTLPYTRMPHPRYAEKAEIPAYNMIRDSVNIHKGCFGGCSFCTISAHQGKFIKSRSENSILNELKLLVLTPGFKGHVSDLGGPSANMYKMQGFNLDICKKCKKPSCIYPTICKNLNTNHSTITELYKKAAQVPGIKKITIGSGIRYDMLIDGRSENNKDNNEYLKTLIKNHVSGRLKVAPEHTSDEVLKLMRKPSFTIFKQFNRIFTEINRKEGLQQQLIPYFISSHPGSTLCDMAHLAIETKNLQFRLEQVQDLTPTPLTLSSIIFYTGFDPYTRKPVFVPKTTEEKQKQQKFLLWYKKENKASITKELRKLGREDLLKKIYS